MSEQPKLEIPTNLRNYQLSFLTKGERWTAENTPEVQALMVAHLAFNRRMIESGKFVFAGPLTDNGFVRGICVVATVSLEEAKALCGEDPAVQAGHFARELHPAAFPGLDTVKVVYGAQ